MAVSEMKSSRISDEDAAALLDGGVPTGGTEVRAVSEAITRIRAASRNTVARPSDELLLLLRPEAAGGLVDASGSVGDRVGPGGPARGKTLTAFGWFAGLGLGVKLLLVGGAAAATVVGAATLVPPTPASDAPPPVVSATAEPLEPSESFEQGADPVADPGPEPTDLPSGVPTFDPCATPFGEQVSPVAKDKPGSGREFGEGVSSAAREKGECAGVGTDDGQDASSGKPGGDAADPGEHGGRAEHAPGASHGPSDRVPEHAGNGNGNGNGNGAGHGRGH
jgi:hypothetical protein